MIYSDQDGFEPQIIAQVCVCVALLPGDNSRAETPTRVHR